MKKIILLLLANLGIYGAVNAMSIEKYINYVKNEIESLLRFRNANLNDVASKQNIQDNFSYFSTHFDEFSQVTKISILHMLFFYADLLELFSNYIEMFQKANVIEGAGAATDLTYENIVEKFKNEIKKMAANASIKRTLVNKISFEDIQSLFDKNLEFIKDTDKRVDAKLIGLLYNRDKYSPQANRDIKALANFYLIILESFNRILNKFKNENPK